MVLLMFIYALLMGPALAAEGQTFAFNEYTQYSICYKLNDWNVGLIDSTTINNVKEIGGKNFLVYTRKHFSSKDADNAFIMMDSIVAILPTEQVRSQGEMFCRPTKNCPDRPSKL